VSRGDVWSAAITLVIAGAAIFINSKWTAWGSIILGSGAIIVLLLWPEKKEQTGSSSATAKAEANPKQEQVFNPNFNPVITQEAPKVEINFGRESEPYPRRIQEPKLTPTSNLQFRFCKMAKLDIEYSDHGATEGFSLSRETGHLHPNAAIACIKNVSRDGPTAEVDRVRATMTFKDASGQEVGHGVSRGCWLANKLTDANFEVETTHCAVLIYFDGDEAATPYIKEEITEYGLGITAEPCILNPVPKYIELILVSGNQRAMPPMTFELGQNGAGDRWIKLVADMVSPKE